MLYAFVIKTLGRVKHRLTSRRAAVALIVALCTPLLLGVTGLSVDVGYWYQQQESLQSAVDAGAMAVGNTISNDYGNLTTSQAVSFAVAAANNATANQFNLTSASVSVSANTASTPVKWTVSATIPRSDFFTTATSGEGLLGLNIGNQTAAASIDILQPTVAPGTCLLTTGTSGTTVYVADSGAEVLCKSGTIYSDSTSSCGIEAYGTVIMGPTVTTNGPETSSCANWSGAYIGVTATNPSTPSVSGVTVVSNKPDTDPGAAMDPLSTSGYSDLTWPTMPTAPTQPTGLTTGSFNNIQNNGNPGSVPYNLPGNYKYNNLTNLGGSTMYIGTLSSSPNTATTLVTGGISITGSGFSSTVSIYGYEFYLNGGLSIGFQSSGQTFSTVPGAAPSGAAADASNPNQLSTYILNGETNFSQNGNGANIALGQGRFFFENSGGTALQLGNSQTVSFASGTDAYFNGSFSPGTSGANNDNITFGSGLYVFSSAFESASGATTFSGGTYYFYGGLSFGNSTTSVTFGPGIYYIENGELNLSQAQSIVANGATFVLEGTAYYNFNESTTNGLILAAPTTNCVALSSFPEASYQTKSPFDGTNGEGICNVLIYQDRNDTQQDQMIADTAISLTGIIYQPNAALNLSSGNYQIAPTTTTTNGVTNYNMLEIVASSVSDTGPQLILSSGGSSSSSSSSGPTKTEALLVQ